MGDAGIDKTRADPCNTRHQATGPSATRVRPRHLPRRVPAIARRATSPIADLPDEAYDRSVALNPTGVFIASQEALRHLGAGGRIVTIGSVNADRVHFGGGSVYALTKAGIAGFTSALARQVGPPGHHRQHRPARPRGHGQEPRRRAFAGFTRPRVAVDRDGGPAEVASLAGPESSHVTGATLNSDGGCSA